MDFALVALGKAKAMELTWREAIHEVLATASTPLHYNDIAERIIADGLRMNLGATPAKSVNAVISASITHEHDASPYVRVARGIVALKQARAAGTPTVKEKLTPTVEESDV